MTKAVGKAMATLRHMAAIGLPPAMVFDDAMDCLKETVSFDSAALVLYGDEPQPIDALLTNDVAPDVLGRYFTHWFGREESRYIPTHAQVAAGRTPDVFPVSAFTPRFWETAIYDEVFRHVGSRHMACLALRRGRRPSAFMSLCRDGSDFTWPELKALRETLGVLTAALGAGPAEERRFETSALVDVDRALIIADANGRLLQLTDNGWRLLLWARMAADGEPTQPPWSHTPDRNETYAWVRPLLAELAARVQAGLDGRPGPPAMMRRRSDHGEFVLRAHALHGGAPGAQGGLIAVEIERRAPVEARLFASAAFRKLTFQEQMVARLTIRGATHAEIAEELGVSVHTVVSHVRSAYRRTGASSRETLLAALLPRPDRDQATGSAVPA